jgi:hypothetical protein
VRFGNVAGLRPSCRISRDIAIREAWWRCCCTFKVGKWVPVGSGLARGEHATPEFADCAMMGFFAFLEAAEDEEGQRTKG